MNYRQCWMEPDPYSDDDLTQEYWVCKSRWVFGQADDPRIVEEWETASLEVDPPAHYLKKWDPVVRERYGFGANRYYERIETLPCGTRVWRKYNHVGRCIHEALAERVGK